MIKQWRALPRQPRTLLSGVLLTSITTFMLIPLLALHLTRSGQSIAEASLVVAILAGTQQVAALFAGIAVDRWGAGRCLAAGLALRILGYLLLGGQSGLAGKGFSAGLIGLGAAMLTISILAMLGGTQDAGRGIFALRGTFINIGAVLGPLLGGLAIQAGFAWITTAAVLSHVLFGLLLYRDRPYPTAGAVRKPSPLRGIRNLMRSREAIVAMTGKLLFWFFYSQLNLTVPLYVTAVTHTRNTIVFLFAINGAVVIALQYPLMRKIPQTVSQGLLAGAGLLCYGLCYAILGASAGMVALLAFILLATLGEMILGPTTYDAILQAAPEELRGSALGLSSLWASAGSVLGVTAGGDVFQHIPAAHRQAYWIAMAVLAVLGAAVLAGFSGELARRRRQVTPAAVPDGKRTADAATP